MIHLRFVLDNKIMGYGTITPYPHASHGGGLKFFTSPDRNEWMRMPPFYDLIERGIEVRGEVWYEGDVILYGSGKAIVTWDGMAFILVGVEYPEHEFPRDWKNTKNMKRIGNVHEEVRP